MNTSLGPLVHFRFLGGRGRHLFEVDQIIEHVTIKQQYYDDKKPLIPSSDLNLNNTLLIKYFILIR